jgi:hypothetical protein
MKSLTITLGGRSKNGILAIYTDANYSMTLDDQKSQVGYIIY